MIPQQLTQDQLIAMLAWQVEMGADEAVLDKPSHDLQDQLSLHDISGSSPASSASVPSANCQPLQSAPSSLCNICNVTMFGPMDSPHPPRFSHNPTRSS